MVESRRSSSSSGDSEDEFGNFDFEAAIQRYRERRQARKDRPQNWYMKYFDGRLNLQTPRFQVKAEFHMPAVDHMKLREGATQVVMDQFVDIGPDENLKAPERKPAVQLDASFAHAPSFATAGMQKIPLASEGEDSDAEDILQEQLPL